MFEAGVECEKLVKVEAQQDRVGEAVVMLWRRLEIVPWMRTRGRRIGAARQG